VADTPANRENAFWAPLIGRRISVLSVEADGLLTVVLDDLGLCVGVQPERFTAAPFRSWWRRLWAWLMERIQ
jgi:hypothetical protein